MSIDRKDQHVEWCLPVEFNIYQARALKLELESALALQLPLVCELSAIEEMDGAALQLLLLAARECQLLRIPLRFKAPSQVCLEACSVMGFAGILEPTP